MRYSLYYIDYAIRSKLTFEHIMFIISNLRIMMMELLMGPLVMLQLLNLKPACMDCRCSSHALKFPLSNIAI